MSSIYSSSCLIVFESLFTPLLESCLSGENDAICFVSLAFYSCLRLKLISESSGPFNMIRLSSRGKMHDLLLAQIDLLSYLTPILRKTFHSGPKSYQFDFLSMSCNRNIHFQTCPTKTEKILQQFSVHTGLI